MRIVQLLPELNEGGVERGTMELSRELVKLGHESIVISAGGKLAEQIKKDGGTHITFDVCSKNPFTAPFRMLQLRKILKSLNPDILHARSRIPAWLTYLANKKLHIPFVTTVHGFNSVSPYSAVMTKGDRVICVSGAIKTYIQKHYQTADEKITVIPRGIDLEKFNPKNVDAQFMDAFKEKHALRDKFIVTSVGRITQLKDLETFISAIAVLKHNHPNIVGLIVGGVREDKQEYFHSLEILVKELGLEDNIIFTGSQSKVAEIYALSDVIVSSSKKPESFGRSVAEALALDTPVVATGHGGVLDIIVEGDNGFFYLVGKSEKLAMCINKCRHLKFDGYTYISENFSLEQMVGQTFKVYRNLLNNKGKIIEMHNLFLVQTPFQLFNAIEAKNRFHSNEKNILIIIYKGQQKNLDQIHKILDYDSEWFEVIQIDFVTKIQRFLYPILINNMIKKLNRFKINTIYVALYRNIAAHIINSVKHEDTVIYDDGNNIFKTINFLDNNKKKSFQVFRKIISVLLLRKTDIGFIYKSTIFTLFDISLFQNIKNKIIQNDFSYFKTKIRSLEKEEDVFFIGSRIIDNGISRDVFEVSLEKVVKFYKEINKNVKYVPHRYEDIEYLDKLSQKLKFILTPFSSIIEFEFIMKGIDPSEVATFRSTAVDTLKIIYNPKVRIFKIGLDKIDKNKQEEFKLVYKNFENKKYEIKSII